MTTRAKDGIFKRKKLLMDPHLYLVQSYSDPALFVKKSGATPLILLLYVDDIILTGNDLTATDSLIYSLSAEFDMKDLGQLSYF